MWTLVRPKGLCWIYDSKSNEYHLPFQRKSCKICKRTNACNLIGNFLDGSKRQYCSEFKEK
jgi:hypothetical protein